MESKSLEDKCNGVTFEFDVISNLVGGWNIIEQCYTQTECQYSEEISELCTEAYNILDVMAQQCLVAAFFEFCGHEECATPLLKAITKNCDRIGELSLKCRAILSGVLVPQDVHIEEHAGDTMQNKESDEASISTFEDLLKPILQHMKDCGLGEITIKRKGKEEA